MNEHTINEKQNTEQKEMNFPLYFLAKKPNYQSEEILEVTDGPFSSEEKAESEGRTKYGWKISNYAILKTEQTFQVAKIRISN